MIQSSITNRSLEYLEGALNALEVETRDDKQNWLPACVVLESLVSKWGDMSQKQKETVSAYFDKPKVQTVTYRTIDVSQDISENTCKQLVDEVNRYAPSVFG